jgi:DNA polymerase III alpha subunit
VKTKLKKSLLWWKEDRKTYMECDVTIKRMKTEEYHLDFFWPENTRSLLVATNNTFGRQVRMLNAHDILLCKRNRKTNDTNRSWSWLSQAGLLREYYFKTGEEMKTFTDSCLEGFEFSGRGGGR